MKCRLNDRRKTRSLLIVGLVLIAFGAIAGFLIPEEMHLETRIAGFVSGLGTSLAVIAGVLMLRRARMGEAKMKESELTMTDERGLAVAYRAQSVAAIAAVFAMIVMMLAALVRGDSFYMFMGSMLLCAVALIKLVAWHIYNRIM